MIFSKYRETCEVLLDYLKIGGDDIVEDYAKKGIRNLLHANIDVVDCRFPFFMCDLLKGPVISTFISKSHVCTM